MLIDMTRPKVCVIGMGYVGLIMGATFAKHGFETTCTDAIKSKVDALNEGKPHFYEQDLDELIKDATGSGLLHGATDNIGTVKKSDISFICVGTPSLPDGSIDLNYIKATAKDIGTALKDMDQYHVVVAKSTIIPTTTENVILPILEKNSGKKIGSAFGLCMNPEFLREGNAVHDALNPDRIVVGEFDKKSGDAVLKLYESFDCPKLRVDLTTAEMIKYVANSLLATKITFANEIANLCEKYGIDVYDVMNGVGLDFRIGPHFLQAGAGFGGSCFPKDVNALVAAAKSQDIELKILDAVLDINDRQPLRVVELAEAAVKNLKGKTIAVLGLAFKPETDDVRFTRALPIIEALIKKGANVKVYDPKAMGNFKKLTSKKITYSETAKEALRNSDVCIVQSDWQEFKNLKAQDFKALMNAPIVIDGRRTYNPDELLKAGVVYKGIGWKNLDK